MWRRVNDIRVSLSASSALQPSRSQQSSTCRVWLFFSCFPTSTHTQLWTWVLHVYALSHIHTLHKRSQGQCQCHRTTASLVSGHFCFLLVLSWVLHSHTYFTWRTPSVLTSLTHRSHLFREVTKTGTSAHHNSWSRDFELSSWSYRLLHFVLRKLEIQTLQCKWNTAAQWGREGLLWRVGSVAVEESLRALCCRDTCPTGKAEWQSGNSVVTYTASCSDSLTLINPV